nr:glutathione S-transferase family protein [Jannaschia sp. Os4]
MIGHAPSIYTWTARLVLAHLRLPYAYAEADPFAGDPVPHPMGRVPVLRCGERVLYETGAITRHLDRRAGGTMTPADPWAAARMDQVIGIVDAYAYWPMVRQVYAHAVFRPAHGEAGDPEAVAAGLAAAGPVLDMLEEIAAEGAALGAERTLACAHLAPVLAAFGTAPTGGAMIAARPALARWAGGLRGWPAFAATVDAALPRRGST